MAGGRLVLVVGPSGAGKDTLIGKAREALAEDRRFAFVRRVVTREAVAALEAHDTMERHAFEAAQERGAFALSWEAHGLLYGIPASIDAGMAAGQVIVANGSRKALSAARARYPACMVLLVTAEAAVREARLVARGRESAEEVRARLAREGAELPAHVDHIAIDNSGALDASLATFIVALGAIADEVNPAPPSRIVR